MNQAEDEETWFNELASADTPPRPVHKYSRTVLVAVVAIVVAAGLIALPIVLVVSGIAGAFAHVLTGISNIYR